MGVMNPNLLIQVQDELFGEFDFINDWKEIFAIANPITRKQARDQFVDKEKKYYWKYKKKDDDGDSSCLMKFNGLVKLAYTHRALLTEREVNEAGYNPDMYEKEEAE